MFCPIMWCSEERAISWYCNAGCSLMGRPICDISETLNFNRESDFSQDVRAQYFSLVAADANYFVRHVRRGGLRVDEGCAGFSAEEKIVLSARREFSGRTLNIGSEKLPRR